MKFATLLAIFGTLVHASPLGRKFTKREAPGFHAYEGYKVDTSSLDNFIAQQPAVSWYYLLQNIDYPDGQLTSAVPGVVIASPSTSGPDYYYQWTRDTAITFLSVIDEIKDQGAFNESLGEIVEYFINNTYTLQRTSNPSGNFDDDNHKGLGEAKFNTDDSAYTGAWGRPQNDGPALRSYAIGKYLDVVKEKNDGKLVLAGKDDIVFSSTDDVYSKIIKPDLEFVVNYWSSTGFDVWEENQGKHFFTSLVQLKAVSSGVKIATSHDDSDFASTLSSTKESLNNFISGSESGFVNAEAGHIVENPDLYSSTRGGLDSATFIASILTHPFADKDDSFPFDSDNEYVLQSLYLLLNDNKKRYKFNADYKAGAAIGRYPEDVYDGVGSSQGNPWFLSTAYAGQVFYKIAYNSLAGSKDLKINKLNYDLYNDYIIDLSAIDSNYKSSDSVTIEHGSDNYNKAISNLIAFGDSFVQVILDHISPDGSLAEEIDRDSGEPTGAISLTWSSGAFYDTIKLRSATIALQK